jgi:hypothetical protein
MERVRFITHQGKKILLIDFSNSAPKEVIEVIEQAKSVIKTQPLGSLLTLTDTTGTRFNEEVSVKMKEYAAHNKPYVRAGAAVGITGLRKIIFNATLLFSRRNITTFDDLEAAKNWLSSQ